MCQFCPLKCRFCSLQCRLSEEKREKDGATKDQNRTCSPSCALNNARIPYHVAIQPRTCSSFKVCVFLINVWQSSDSAWIPSLALLRAICKPEWLTRFLKIVLLLVRGRFPVTASVHYSTFERRRTFITKIHANFVFQACISFLRCFRHLALQ